MPTTYTKTLKASGGDYTSFAAWQSAHGGATSKDLVTEDEAVVLEFYKGDYTSLGGGVNYIDDSEDLTGWTCDATRNIKLTCPDTERHDGTPESGFWWATNDSYDQSLRINSVDNVFIEWLEFDNYQGTPSSNYGGFKATNANNSYMRACILHGSVSCSSRNFIFENCLFMDSDYASNVQHCTWGDWTGPHFLNCGFHGATSYAIKQAATVGAYTTKIINCWKYGGAGTFYDEATATNWHADTGYNAHDDNATDDVPDEVGSSNYTTDVDSDDFEDAANDDFHLASGSPLIDKGVNLTSDFTGDVDGDTRPSTGDWDIGFDHYASSGYTLTADAGSFAITGIAASLEHHREIAADAGSFAITGIAASLEHHREIAADAGSFAITGAAASLEHHREIAADAGSFAITGFDATFSVGDNTVLNAEAGSFVITGFDATLTVAGDTVLTAESGSFAITGFDATLSKSIVLPAEAGAVDVTGFDASFDYAKAIAAEAGAFVITGFAANLQYSNEMSFAIVSSEQEINALAGSANQSINRTLSQAGSLT